MIGRYALVRKNDIANGTGVRTTLWVQGCSHRCKGCQNPQTWNFNGGSPFTEETLEMIKEYIHADGITRDFTILGGEPFEYENLEMCISAINAVREVHPMASIWIYSGYLYEDMLADPKRRKLLELCDVLVDGKFIQELYNIKLKLKGSSNQRIIDVQKSIKDNTVVEFEI